jgi:protein-tyrosine phosphatase
MRILMVCLGNICRSPMAEGILRNKAEECQLDIIIDSAGTGEWHIGENPDKRAVQTAKQYGVDISQSIARQFSTSDFHEFDRIYVMDKSNYYTVLDMARSEEDKQKVFLLLNADQPDSNREVPDPYFGNGDGFTKVFIMMDKACEAIIAELKKTQAKNS